MVAEPQVVITVFQHVRDVVVSLGEVFEKMLTISANIISDALLTQNGESSVGIVDSRNVS